MSNVVPPPEGPATPWLSRARLWLVIAGVVGIAVIAVGVYSLSPASSRPPITIAPPASHSALPVPSPAPPPPAAPLRWSDKEMEQMLRLGRLEWEAKQHLPKK
jgi:hypothetical protein